LSLDLDWDGGHRYNRLIVIYIGGKGEICMQLSDMILVSLDDHLVEPPETFADVPMTALHAINATPVVVAAPPGVYSSQDLPRYYARDVRFGSSRR